MGSASKMLHVHDMGVIEVRHDFCSYVTGADGLNTTASDSGAITAADAFGGRRLIEPSDVSVVDNDETYLTTDKCFLFQPDKPAYCAAYFKTAVTTASAFNVIFGWSSAAVADSLQDDGAGPPGTYSGAVWYKVDGTSVWNCETSKSTTQVTSTGEATFTDATDELFEIKFFPNDAVKGTIEFWHKGVLQYTDSNVSTASHAVMRGILGCKLGASTNHDKVNVDWVVFKQLR